MLELGSVGAFDENGLGEPAVWTSGGSYWMLYTGRDRGEHRRMGLAWSRDGVHWERDAKFAPVGGDQSWNREVLCDPSVEVSGIRSGCGLEEEMCLLRSRNSWADRAGSDKTKRHLDIHCRLLHSMSREAIRPSLCSNFAMFPNCFAASPPWRTSAFRRAPAR